MAFILTNIGGGYSGMYTQDSSPDPEPELPLQPQTKPPALKPECWHDPETEKIDADKAMREVRLLCGGDPDKGRNKP